jgi:hypothetical protein
MVELRSRIDTYFWWPDAAALISSVYKKFSIPREGLRCTGSNHPSFILVQMRDSTRR